MTYCWQEYWQGRHVAGGRQCSSVFISDYHIQERALRRRLEREAVETQQLLLNTSQMINAEKTKALNEELDHQAELQLAKDKVGQNYFRDKVQSCGEIH